MLSLAQQEKTVSFEKIFEDCENRVHAIFLFLSLLELVQQKFLKIIIGEGRNNFIIEYNRTGKSSCGIGRNSIITKTS